MSYVMNTCHVHVLHTVSLYYTLTKVPTFVVYVSVVPKRKFFVVFPLSTYLGANGIKKQLI